MRRSDPPDLETVKQPSRVGYHGATWAWREFALGLGRRGLPWDEDAPRR